MLLAPRPDVGGKGTNLLSRGGAKAGSRGSASRGRGA